MQLIIISQHPTDAKHQTESKFFNGTNLNQISLRVVFLHDYDVELQMQTSLNEILSTEAQTSLGED
ncbi:hypothetical protein T4B_2484 [Trichinella pseudospiralis]|uniref:Uncharacterized protein n=2 Tax=Trichinella pseudospiralis TaxID=6337 RepID=A0A0V1F9N7_TRIPS|nr:hypothetical protein T4D_5365 [Trichinella pseudospiralis]KRZ08755.1 hypothetical protein T4B_2484 [Trichinella pseudospiralis]